MRSPAAGRQFLGHARILAGRLAPLLAAIALTFAGVAGVYSPVRQAAASTGGESPQRIVAIGGAVTEILYALGLGGQIVGVDTTSLYPVEALKTKVNIGYFRAFSAEGVLSLNPSIVIASDGAGPPDAIKLLKDAGVTFETLPNDFSAQGVVQKIQIIGRLVHADEKAARLSKAVAAGFRDLSARSTAVRKRVRALLVLTLQNGRPLVAGRGTAGDAMIKLAGGVNVADDFTGYKQMNDEAIVAAAPDVVVMMGSGGHPTASELFSLPEFALTTAAARHRLVLMDGLSLLGFGPRTPRAASELLSAFYPASDAKP